MIVGGQGSLQKMEMRINEKIYTCDHIAKGSEKEIMEAVLRHVLTIEQTNPPAPAPLERSRAASVSKMETVSEEESSMGSKEKS